jgi:hypothetical protein
MRTYIILGLIREVLQHIFNLRFGVLQGIEHLRVERDRAIIKPVPQHAVIVVWMARTLVFAGYEVPVIIFGLVGLDVIKDTFQRFADVLREFHGGFLLLIWGMRGGISAAPPEAYAAFLGIGFLYRSV